MKTKIILISFLFLSLLFVSKSYSQNFLLNSNYGNSIDTIAATSANDTSSTFLNPKARTPIYFAFLSSTYWRVARIEFPNIYQYRAIYLTADSSYYIEGQVAGVWLRLPITFYSTATNKATVIAKTTVSQIRFYYY